VRQIIRCASPRYLTEDVPCGLVPISELGRAAGVPTPTIDGLIAVVSAMIGRDLRAEGRTLARLGLADKNAAQIRATVLG
jgi:opine dehydrogenase